MSSKNKSINIRRWVCKRLISFGVNKIDGRNVNKCSNKEIFSKYFNVFNEDAIESFNNVVDNKYSYEKKECKIVALNKKYKKAFNAEDDGYIYLIGSLKYGFVKIGYSKNPHKRLKEIQVGCPFEVNILSVAKGNMLKEKLIHKKYSKYKSFGEWFFIKGEVELMVKKEMDRISNKTH